MTDRPQVDLPAPFEMAFQGPQGTYRCAYEPNDDEGTIDVDLGGIRMFWHVETVNKDADGRWVLSGLTTGSSAIWGDIFWFAMHTGRHPRIELWGNQVIVRTDPRVTADEAAGS